MEALSLTGQDVAPPLAGGRYRLLSELGRGGMATVYRGHDERLSRDVAVKVLNQALAGNPVLRARFVQEARTMARLGAHGGVVQIYDFGQDEHDQRMFIAMELLPGTVQQILERHGPLPPRLATQVILGVLEVLEVAHERRVVHRDVKPSNILLTREGAPKVGDFGIARIVRTEHEGHLTRTGAGVGTWAYMAPEQKRDAGAVDHRADIYGVGATLFALLVNQEPHDIDRVETWTEQLASIPAPLREIIVRATRYAPDERYATAAALRQALADCLDELPPDPPGASRLLVSAEITREPPSPPTLVPDFKPTPSLGPARTETNRTWPPVDHGARRLALGVLAIGALALLGLWWALRTPPAPLKPASSAPAEPVIAQQVVTPPPQPPIEPEPAVPSSPVSTPGGGAGAVADRVDGRKDKEPPPRTPEGTRTATTPATPAPPALVPVEVIKVGSGTCLLQVDRRAFAVNNSAYYASETRGATVRLPTGQHRLSCQSGEEVAVEVREGLSQTVKLPVPTGAPP